MTGVRTDVRTGKDIASKMTINLFELKQTLSYPEVVNEESYDFDDTRKVFIIKNNQYTTISPIEVWNCDSSTDRPTN